MREIKHVYVCAYVCVVSVYMCVCRCACMCVHTVLCVCFSVSKYRIVYMDLIEL